MNSGERIRPPDRPAATGEAYIDYGPPIPDKYGILTIRALARDPRAVFAYWEWPALEENRIWAVRLRDTVTGTVFIKTLDRAAAALGAFHFEAVPERTYEIDLGWSDGEHFHAVKTSNRVRTPRDGPATEIDVDWVPGPGEAAVLEGFVGQVFVAGSLHLGIRPGPSHG